MACLEPFVAAPHLCRVCPGLMDYMHTQDMWQKGWFQMFEATMIVTIMSFADGAALWADKPGQQLLHERHSAVSAVRARAQDCTQEVAQNIY